MRRDIFYRNTEMKYGTRHRDEPGHFDPEFPKGLQTTSKPLSNWKQGEPDWKSRDDAVVTPGGRQTERTRNRVPEPCFGIPVIIAKRGRK